MNFIKTSQRVIENEKGTGTQNNGNKIQQKKL